MELAARIGTWSGKPLPYDAEVEYLESNGSSDQRFDIGFGPNDSTVIELEYMEVSDTGTRSYVCGCMRQGPGSTVWRFHHAQRLNGACFSAVSDGMLFNGSIAGASSWNHLKIDGSSGVYVNGDLVFEKYGVIGNNLSNCNFILFGCAIQASYTSPATTFYASSSRIKNIVIDGIEYKTVKRNGIGEIFNTVTKEFVSRIGEFNVGPEK